jgi:hypothetical protein
MKLSTVQQFYIIFNANDSNETQFTIHPIREKEIKTSKLNLLISLIQNILREYEFNNNYDCLTYLIQIFFFILVHFCIHNQTRV